MFVGLFGAKKVGGMRASPKKEGMELEEALMAGPLEGLWVVERKDAIGV